jgi:hypothetical protein
MKPSLTPAETDAMGAIAEVLDSIGQTLEPRPQCPKCQRPFYLEDMEVGSYNEGEPRYVCRYCHPRSWRKKTGKHARRW